MTPDTIFQRRRSGTPSASHDIRPDAAARCSYERAFKRTFMHEQIFHVARSLAPPAVALLLVASLALSFVADAAAAVPPVGLPAAPQKAAGATSTNLAPRASTDDVTAAVGRAFGASVEAVARFSPFYLIGDFNNDRSQDLMVVVRLKARRGELPKDVRVLNPYGYGEVPGPGESSVRDGRGVALAFAVIHGGAGGWRAGDPAAKFLLLGRSPVLIMNHERAESTVPGDYGSLMELVSSKSAGRRKRYAEMRLPATATGDWALVGTEAAEAVLFWDGKTYRFRESAEGF